MAESSKPATVEEALPQTPFYSVEYPGYVQSSSVPLAIQNLGGQRTIDNAFKRSASKTEALVELNLRPGNAFSHPIPGDVVNTNNILLKIVRRKRKRRDGTSTSIGEYTAEAIGVITKTVRFRSMADYQFQPDRNDPICKLRKAMDDMDVDAILEYRIPEEKADYVLPVQKTAETRDVDMQLDPQLAQNTPQSASAENATRSGLRMIPPPLFGRQAISQPYNFKGNIASMVTTTVDEETGEEKKRLINKMRWKGYGPATILFTENKVPEKSPPPVEETRAFVDQTLLKRLQEVFEERPVWTRMALLNQFSHAQAREIHNSKVLIPLVCYVFQDGPWRDTLLRFGYDPRQQPEARFYQRLYFRNLNHPICRPSIITSRQDRVVAASETRGSFTREEGDPQRNSHIFDGRTITKETAAFQLCDIHDAMLKDMVNSTEDLREACNERDGWFTTHALEQIKTILRYKFFSLLEGHLATDEECAELLVPLGTKPKTIATSRAKLKAGKHNMAKGALRPEDAAAVRLSQILEHNARLLKESR